MKLQKKKLCGMYEENKTIWLTQPLKIKARKKTKTKQN